MEKKFPTLNEWALTRKQENYKKFLKKKAKKDAKRKRWENSK